MPSVSLVSAPGMKHHHPILVTLGRNAGQVKREIGKPRGYMHMLVPNMISLHPFVMTIKNTIHVGLFTI